MTNQAIIDAFANTVYPFLYRNKDGSLVTSEDGTIRFHCDGYPVFDNSPIQPFGGLKVSMSEYKKIIEDAVGDWFSDLCPPSVYAFYAVGVISKEDIITKLIKKKGSVICDFVDGPTLVRGANLFHLELAKAWDKIEGKTYPDEIYTNSCSNWRNTYDHLQNVEG